jgi:signal transduction histidine kinase
VLSESLTALAFLLIAATLARIVRGRRDCGFGAVFYCFGGFLVASGVCHAMRVAMVWRLHARMEIALEATTAAISLLTFGVLWQLVPETLAIPERAEMERANRQLASVLEHTAVCVLAMDGAWKITYLNSHAEALLNVLGELRGMSFWDAFPTLDPSTPETLRRVMKTREPASYEDRYEPFELTTTVQAHPWDAGGIALFFNDVREQKRLQRALEKERALREQRIDVLARLSGELAHEIKNPLAIIRARASDLCELAELGGAPTANEVTQTCHSIVKTSDRAIGILRGLEALAHEGTRDPMLPADVGALVEQAVDLVRRRFNTHGILLETAIAAGLPKVECREVQIGQILMNLLTNAFDAVDADPGSKRWVRVNVSAEESSVGPERLRVDVVDGGPGVAVQHREHVMERFFTTKPVGVGIGIGLSVSRAIAEEHGGHLELCDCCGHTCFRLTLPVRTPAHAEQAA